MSPALRRLTLLWALSAASLFAGPAAAASEPPGDLTGTWQGSYTCPQGRTGLTLTFAPDGEGGWTGRFAFAALTDNPDVPGGAFGVVALYDAAESSFHVDPRLWIERPSGFATVTLVGQISEDGQAFAGEVLDEGCTTFLVKRFLS